MTLANLADVTKNKGKEGDYVVKIETK